MGQPSLILQPQRPQSGQPLDTRQRLQRTSRHQLQRHQRQRRNAIKQGRIERHIEQIQFREQWQMQGLIKQLALLVGQ